MIRVGNARAKTTGFALLFGLLLLAACVRVCLGPIAIDNQLALTFALPTESIAALRATSLLSAACVGAALGLSGLALQVLLRNPLASPFVLGVSSGAGFGVALVLALAYACALPAMTFGGEVGGAIVGALAALGLVAWFGRGRSGTHDTTTLVLCGVVLGSIFSAGTMLLEQVVPHGLRGDLLSWMSGRLPEVPDRFNLTVLALCTLSGVILLSARAAALDVSCLSDDEAQSSGVNLRTLRVTLFLVGGVLAAVAVAYAGPIGFIGLIAPHFARRLVGASHRTLVIGSAIAGALLLVSADVIRQIIDVGTGRLPVGVLTALAGGPVFLWLLRSKRWLR